MPVPATTKGPKRAFDSTSGIYCITNTVNNKKYVGLSTNVKYRLKRHLGLLRNGTHFNHHLQNAYGKYGEESFSFKLIEACPSEFLSEREKYWIDKLDTFNNGYNLKTGGHENLVFSEETRRKISESNKGKVINQEHREKIRRTLTGFKHSEEAKRNMGNAHKGEKNGNYKKGHLFSGERRRNMSLAQRGKVYSSEYKKKMSEVKFGNRRKLSNEDELKIYHLHSDGSIKQSELATMFDVSIRTVSRTIARIKNPKKVIY